MAQRRMISRRITESDKILALKGNDRARFIYAALLPYTDKAGRVNVNPKGLAGTIFEGFEWTTDEITEALQALARVGLITLYAGRKHTLLAEYTNFEEFNKPHPKEAESELPGPNDESMAVLTPSPVKEPVVTAQSPTRNIPENNPKKETQGSTLTLTPTLTVFKGSKEDDRSKKPRELERSPPLQLYLELWNTNRGTLPAIEVINDDRERALKKLLKRHKDELPDLFRDAVRAVASNDFWTQNRYGFDTLVPGKVLKYAEQWRHSGSGLSPGNARLVTNIQRWDKALPPDSPAREEVN